MRKCDAMTQSGPNEGNACLSNGAFDRVIDGMRYNVCDSHKKTKEENFQAIRPGTYVAQRQIFWNLDPASSTHPRVAEVYRKAGAINIKELRPVTSAFLSKENHNTMENTMPINQDPTDFKEDREMTDEEINQASANYSPEKAFVIAGTGTRSIWGNKEAMRALHTKLVTLITGAINKHGKVIVISGGAKGFDYVLARAALEAGAELHVYLPSPTYLDYYWGTEGQERNWINKIVDLDVVAVKTVCDDHLHGKANFRRNEAMIDECDIVWAYPDPANTTGKGGTYSAIRYAIRTDRRVHTVTV